MPTKRSKVTVAKAEIHPALAEGDDSEESRAGRAPAARSTTGDLLNLVQELAGFDRIGVTRLARHMEIPVATTYRMLRTLERTGYVEQLRESKEYRLTLKLFELGCQVASRTTMRDVASIEIERLAQQAQLTANLGVLVQDHVLYLERVEMSDVVTLNLRPGSRVPATCTAMGKAMLAAETRPIREIVGDGPYPARTENSIVTYHDLMAEVARIQRVGYAVDCEEFNLALWCVAAPIMGSRQAQNGAVSLASYGVRLDENERERLGKLVTACAHRISRRIGDLDGMHSWVHERAIYPRP
jgi:DNA-binding IclR family transcriptional regulator